MALWSLLFRTEFIGIQIFYYLKVDNSDNNQSTSDIQNIWVLETEHQWLSTIVVWDVVCLRAKADMGLTVWPV